jgi:endonuclease/exonuclease/phosphatase family metal-dependent hydrolase
VTWNIEWFPGRQPNAGHHERREHMAAAREVVEKLDPDILLLQEIEGWPSAMELVSGIPGMHVHVVSQFFESSQNLVIASKLPLDSAWFEPWKDATPNTPPRGFAFAALQLAENRFLLLYTVHYKSNLGNAVSNFAKRQQASRQLLEHAARMAEIYSARGKTVLLIGGDFNSSLDDPQFASDLSVRAMKKAGLDWVHEEIPFNERITWPAREPFADTCFDHIFSSGLERQATFVVSTPEVSDHNPVVARFALTADKSTKLNLAHLDELAPPPLALPLPGQSASTLPDNLPAGTFCATQTELLKTKEGQTIRVRGVVRRIGESPSGNLQFINFGTRRGDFTAIIRRSNRAALSRTAGGSSYFESLPGKQVEIQGRVELYKDNPQIEIRQPSQIHLLQP